MKDDVYLRDRIDGVEAAALRVRTAFERGEDVVGPARLLVESSKFLLKVAKERGSKR